MTAVHDPRKNSATGFGTANVSRPSSRGRGIGTLTFRLTTTFGVNSGGHEMKRLALILVTLVPLSSLRSAEPSDVKVRWVSGPTLAIEIDPAKSATDPKKGVRISSVRPGCNPNLKDNDVVLSVDGKEIIGKAEGLKALSNLQVGRDVELRIQRETLTAINRPVKKHLTVKAKVMQYGEWAFSQTVRSDDNVRLGESRFRLKDSLLSFDRSVKSVEPVFSVSESGDVQLLWLFSYTGQEWLFINSIEFRIHDRVVTVPINDSDVVREAIAGGVVEQVTFPVPLDDLALVNALGTVTEIPVSYGGSKGRRQFTLKGDELQAIWAGTAAAVWKAANPD